MFSSNTSHQLQPTKVKFEIWTVTYLIFLSVTDSPVIDLNIKKLNLK